MAEVVPTVGTQGFEGEPPYMLVTAIASNTSLTVSANYPGVGTTSGTLLKTDEFAGTPIEGVSLTWGIEG